MPVRTSLVIMVWVMRIRTAPRSCHVDEGVHQGGDGGDVLGGGLVAVLEGDHVRQLLVHVDPGHRGRSASGGRTGGWWWWRGSMPKRSWPSPEPPPWPRRHLQRGHVGARGVGHREARLRQLRDRESRCCRRPVPVVARRRVAEIHRQGGSLRVDRGVVEIDLSRLVVDHVVLAAPFLQLHGGRSTVEIWTDPWDRFR